MRRKILVLAYSISPMRGSEYSVGWNYVKEMSLDNELIVLFGSAGEHMGDVEEVVESDQCQTMPNVRFVAVNPSSYTKLLNFFNKNGIFKYSFYLAYRLWHMEAYLLAKKLIAQEPIDLIHYLCPIGFREPGYLWKIDKPYIWGPIGGAKNRPAKLILSKSVSSGIKAALYNLINTLQFKFSTRVKSALTRADLLLSSTTEIERLIFDTHKIKSVYLPENAIPHGMLNHQHLVSVFPGERVNILWVGRIDEYKSLDILISALSLMKEQNWHLNVVGNGAKMDALVRMSARLKVDKNITWVGRVSRNEIDKYYIKSHLHVITSLAEANTTVIWEAMSHGIPTITIDHCGMHDTVCPLCGVKIPLSTLDNIITDFASNLERLIASPRLITELSRGVQMCSKKHAWEMRRVDWETYYDIAISNWNNKQQAQNKSIHNA